MDSKELEMIRERIEAHLTSIKEAVKDNDDNEIKYAAERLVWWQGQLELEMSK